MQKHHDVHSVLELDISVHMIRSGPHKSGIPRAVARVGRFPVARELRLIVFCALMVSLPASGEMDVVREVGRQTEFTLDLYKAVLGKKASNGAGEENSVLSPISIATALAMAAAGAKGDTLAELTGVLKLPEGENMHEFASQIKSGVLSDGSGAGGPQLSFASGIWVEKGLGLRSTYQEIVKGKYGAQIRAADFRQKAEDERLAINLWVTDETKGKIEDLLPPSAVTSQTTMILANALYFKGAWTQPFDPEDTRIEKFNLLDGKSVEVPFLSSQKKQYIRDFPTFKVLKLPYARGNDHRSFAMYFVLPNDKAGLAEVEKELDEQSLTQNCRWTSKEVTVGKFLLPKFKLTTGFSVPESLASMGLKIPFSGGADFSGIEEGPNSKLYISDVVHKAFIEVNEEGTEAAAATAVTMLRGFAMPEPPADFVADHPFLFILKDDVTGTVLFIGRITNPSLSE